VKDGPGT
jgi:outer membrane biosynthesis protein TonB